MAGAGRVKTMKPHTVAADFKGISASKFRRNVGRKVSWSLWRLGIQGLSYLLNLIKVFRHVEKALKKVSFFAFGGDEDEASLSPLCTPPHADS